VFEDAGAGDLALLEEAEDMPVSLAGTIEAIKRTNPGRGRGRLDLAGRGRAPFDLNLNDDGEQSEHAEGN
jgi:hypothetical protein